MIKFNHMRLVFILFVLLGMIACKNSENSPESETTEVSNDTAAIVETPNAIDQEYTPTQDKVDTSLLIIEGTKMLDGELGPAKNVLTYRIKGSTSKEMVIQLITKRDDIYFNIRVEEGETITEKQRKFMFTVASSQVLVLDITSDKPLTEKTVVNTIIAQL